MSKTPIMILQELGVKECILPNYDIIVSQNGTRANTFTFRVKYNNLYANGTASNKKEAKQNAAQNMLKLLQGTDNISSKGLKILESFDSDMTTEKLMPSNLIASPSNAINYIGILQEYCVEKKLIEPDYRLCETNGPPHNTKFKMSCTLGTIIEEAVANTKKQAKQDVAQKVLRKLPYLKSNTNSSQCQLVANSNSQKEISEAIFKDLGIEIANLKIVNSKHLDNVKEKYLTATSKETLVPLNYLNEKISVGNYHLYFKSMIYNSICNSKEGELVMLYKTLKAYAEECNENDSLFHGHALTYIKEKCKLPIKRISLNGKNNMTIIGFRINLIVPFTQFAISQNPLHAEQEALTKAIETIILYLQ